jgi:hypothetical protein
MVTPSKIEPAKSPVLHRAVYQAFSQASRHQSRHSRWARARSHCSTLLSGSDAPGTRRPAEGVVGTRSTATAPHPDRRRHRVRAGRGNPLVGTPLSRHAKASGHHQVSRPAWECRVLAAGAGPAATVSRRDDGVCGVRRQVAESVRPCRSAIRLWKNCCSGRAPEVSADRRPDRYPGHGAAGSTRSTAEMGSRGGAGVEIDVSFGCSAKAA